MSDTSSNGGCSLHGLIFCAFIAIKLAGTALAGWSWLWLFMPEVPILALTLQKLGWI